MRWESLLIPLVKLRYVRNKCLKLVLLFLSRSFNIGWWPHHHYQCRCCIIYIEFLNFAKTNKKSTDILLKFSQNFFWTFKNNFPSELLRRNSFTEPLVSKSKDAASAVLQLPCQLPSIPQMSLDCHFHWKVPGRLVHFLHWSKSPHILLNITLLQLQLPTHLSKPVSLHTPQWAKSVV